VEAPTLDRYELKEELGQGGMSVVYRARDRQLGRDVALKILHRYLAKQPEARRRFHREAMAVARLRHRAIVEIFDYSGPDAEDAYIVCELIDGPTLRELVDRVSAPGPEVAMLIALELCGALAHAHGSGIIHRDLKPENVMITPEGQLKLMDFGIAQVLEGNTRLTATGTLVGSPAHMAPEVIDGKPADHRADLFSLGTLLYWLAVGELPFTAPHPSALFKRILDGNFQPADAACPSVGRRTARLIGRCLANDPENRPRSADMLAHALREELAEVDLDPSGSTLRGVLVDPVAGQRAVEARVVPALVERAHDAVKARDWGAASDAVNRILARDPEHAEARAMLERLARGERRSALARRAAVALLALGVVGTSVAFGLRAADRPPRPDRDQSGPRVERSGPPPQPVSSPEPSVRADANAAGPTTPRARGGSARGGGEGPETRASAKPTASGGRPTGAAAGVRRRATPSSPADPQPARRRAPQTKAEPEPTPEVAEAQVAARLTIQIGRGYADVWVDDELVLDLAVRGDVDLRPGRHAIEVVRDRDKILERLEIDEAPQDRPFPQFGRFEPRIVEVDDNGRLFEIGPRGARELKDGILRFSLPTTPREAARIDSWISS